MGNFAGSAKLEQVFKTFEGQACGDEILKRESEPGGARIGAKMGAP